MIKNVDGTYTIPNLKGDPPPGYESIGNDIYAPIVEDCIHRVMFPFVRPCGKYGCRCFCKLIKRDINFIICDDCEKRET